MTKNNDLKKELKPYIDAILDKKAIDTTIIDLRKQAIYTDALIICSGTSSRHVSSLGDNIIKTLKDQKINVLGAEGLREGSWVLLDYGHVVIHIFHSQKRSFYDLETLWDRAERIDIETFE